MAARTLCSDCGKRPISKQQRGAGGSLCEKCEDWAGHENEHNDNCHDEILAGEELLISAEAIAVIRAFMETCPICQNEAHPKDKSGHTNTVAKSYSSHAECGHPRTPKDRQICRARRVAEKVKK